MKTLKNSDGEVIGTSVPEQYGDSTRMNFQDEMIVEFNDQVVSNLVVVETAASWLNSHCGITHPLLNIRSHYLGKSNRISHNKNLVWCRRYSDEKTDQLRIFMEGFVQGIIVQQNAKKVMG